jgi:hypothetical protein
LKEDQPKDSLFLGVRSIRTLTPQEEEDLLKKLESQDKLPTLLMRFRRKLAIRVVHTRSLSLFHFSRNCSSFLFSDFLIDASHILMIIFLLFTAYKLYDVLR